MELSLVELLNVIIENTSLTLSKVNRIERTLINMTIAQDFDQTIQDLDSIVLSLIADNEALLAKINQGQTDLAQEQSKLQSTLDQAKQAHEKFTQVQDQAGAVTAVSGQAPDQPTDGSTQQDPAQLQQENHDLEGTAPTEAVEPRVSEGAQTQAPENTEVSDQPVEVTPETTPGTTPETQPPAGSNS